MKRRVEVTWAVTRVHHERNRYIFNMYYKDKKISKELYDYLVREGYADANLIAKWRKVCHIYMPQQGIPFSSLYEKNKRKTVIIACLMFVC